MFVRSILLFTLFAIASCQSSTVPVSLNAARTVFVNGAVYPVLPVDSMAEALAIEGSTIVFVGSTEAAQRFIDNDTLVVDLDGRMLMPGLIDAHLHPVRGALKKLYHCNFSFTSTPTEVQHAIAACVKAQPENDWIVGGQWDSGFFERYDIESPRAWLDQVSGNKAVYLQDDSLHNVWVNSKTLELAGITADTPDPDGGTIVRDALGNPNGLLLETAAKAISEFKPDFTPEQHKTAVREFVHAANSFGLTGAKTASTFPYELAALQAIDRENGLSLNVATAMRTRDGVRREPLDYESIEQAAKQYASSHVDTRFVKMFLDGVPTPARTAAMLNAYRDDAAHDANFDGGPLLVDAKTLAADLTELDKRGFTVKMHAAGDRSVRIALDAIEATRKSNGASGLHHELAHAGYVSQEDIPRFAKLDAVADLSPVLWHPSPIMEAIYAAVGKERGQYYFPIRDLIDSGAGLLAGSDWPAVAVDANPWAGVEAMVTRKNPHATASEKDETLWPEQAIELHEALTIYTLNGAKALRKEDSTGSLEVGKSADFVILEHNLFTLPPSKLSEVAPLETWFEGKRVFKRTERTLSTP